MTGYKYVSMEDGGSNEVYEAQDEVYINGKSITSQIEGYRQLSISGRDFRPYVVETVESVRRSGARPISYRVEPFDVVVKYVIHAETSVELREKVDQLGMILKQGALNVEFKDEEDFEYFDVFVVGNDGTEELSNTVIRTYTLTFLDPFKYEKYTSIGETVSIDGEFVEVEGIKVVFTETVDRPTIIINNGVYRTSFRLVGQYSAGDVFRLDVDRNTGQVEETGGTVELGTMPRELVVFNGATGIVEEDRQAVVEFAWRGFRG